MSSSTALASLTHILIFDSGVGGLSIAKHVIERNPNCRISYLADDLFFPYGELSEEDLKKRVVDVIDEAHTQLKPDIIVIACNTASTLVLPSLREKYQHTLFVGVVPAVKPAALISKTGHIGVLATTGTITRTYTRTLIDDHAKDKKTFLYGSSSLVQQAEQRIYDKTFDIKTISQELELLWEMDSTQKIDVVVLACTHFPLLRHILEEVCEKQNRKIVFIDSGDAIARRVKSLIETQLERSHNTPCFPLKDRINIYFSSSKNMPASKQKLSRFKEYLLS